MQKILVFTATYNEADNIRELIHSVFEHLPGCEMLVVDDNSPDGTGKILDALSAQDPRIHVIHRPYKNGLGTAHKLSVKYALAQGFDALITMDADFSHHPRYLPLMVEKLQSHDFVTASRYVKGGSCEYPPSRVVLSRTANMLARTLLGLPLHETTTSYRGFRRTLLQTMNVDQIRADGYSYFVESIYQVSRLAKTMTEFPIRFEDRRAGTTKISKKEVINGMTTLLRLAAWRAGKKLGFHPRPLGVDTHPDALSCNVCGCRYHVEEYPASSGLHTDAHASDQYKCSSTEHFSHGRIVQCLGCGLVYTNPQLPQDKVLALYSQVEDTTYLENLDARVRTFSYNFDRISEFLPPKGRLLDVGSYCGVFLKVARERGYEIQGIEPSAWASGYARQTLNIPTLSGGVQDLPPDTDPFDVVCSWDVLEHFSNPMAELTRISRAMRVGGVFAFSTLNYDNWFPRLTGERWPWMMDMHLYYFNERVIREMLRRAGFRLKHAQPYCHIITLEYLLLKLRALGLPGAGLLRALVRKTPLRHAYIPFRFGDIRLFICEKTGEPTESLAPGKKTTVGAKAWAKEVTESGALRA